MKTCLWWAAWSAIGLATAIGLTLVLPPSPFKLIFVVAGVIIVMLLVFFAMVGITKSI